MPRAITMTTYNFSMAVFSFFSMGQLYNFCYGNKNNNDNFANQNNFLKRFGNIEINGNIRIRLVSSLTLHLAYRIFGSITHHTISSALKISVSGKVGDVVEKRNRKLKKEQEFEPNQKVISLNQNFKPKFNVYFFYFFFFFIFIFFFAHQIFLL